MERKYTMVSFCVKMCLWVVWSQPLRDADKDQEGAGIRLVCGWLPRSLSEIPSFPSAPWAAEDASSLKAPSARVLDPAASNPCKTGGDNSILRPSFVPRLTSCHAPYCIRLSTRRCCLVPRLRTRSSFSSPDLRAAQLSYDYIKQTGGSGAWQRMALWLHRARIRLVTGTFTQRRYFWMWLNFVFNR